MEAFHKGNAKRPFVPNEQMQSQIFPIPHTKLHFTLFTCNAAHDGVSCIKCSTPSLDFLLLSTTQNSGLSRLSSQVQLLISIISTNTQVSQTYIHVSDREHKYTQGLWAQWSSENHSLSLHPLHAASFVQRGDLLFGAHTMSCWCAGTFHRSRFPEPSRPKKPSPCLSFSKSFSVSPCTLLSRDS